MRLWNYVSTFSTLTGDRLQQIYSKLKSEQGEEARVGPSQVNGAPTGPRGYKGFDTAKFEAWKRRRRAETDNRAQFQPPHHNNRPNMTNNSTSLPDPNTLGILGSGPSDNRRLFGNERPYRMRQPGFSQKQGFSSGVR